MPWSMYHWLETYRLLCDILDPKRRSRWEQGLVLAYEGIAQGLETARVHNIPTWNGMALYRAGQVFDRPRWLEQGRRMIDRAVEAQTSLGYWREHGGPTTSYNLVYVHAIGLYYAFSGDERVLTCLERATRFHVHYTYPDGRVVETIDGRVKYHDRVPDLAHAAFSLFPSGRRYVRFLVENMLKLRRERPQPHVSVAVTGGVERIVRAEYGLSARLASAYVHYRDGAEDAVPQDDAEYSIHDDGHAIIRRASGWFYCLSGIVTPPADNRWGQDRQAFCSVWHERCGLVVGGGNSREQPEWSTFVVGSGSEVLYLPDWAELHPGDGEDGLRLGYGGQRCSLEVRIADGDCLRLRLRGALRSPAPAHFARTILRAARRRSARPRGDEARLGPAQPALRDGRGDGRGDPGGRARPRRELGGTGRELRRHRR